MANFFQPLVDTTRVFLNSAMGGLPEIAITEAGREQAERNRAENAAARQRLGIVGDVANAAGYIAPLGAISKAPAALRALPKLASPVVKAASHGGRAVQAAERAVARKAVPGYAARESALARLQLPAMPTITGTVGKTVAAHPIKTAVGAGALGVGTMAGYNNRNYDSAQAMPTLTQQQAKPQAAAPSSAGPSTTDKYYEQYGPMLDVQALNAARAQNQAPSSAYDQMVDQVAAAQGGQISIAQMGALAEAYDHSQPRTIGRQPTVRDQLLAQSQAMAEGRYRNAIAQGTPEGEAKEMYRQDIERLLKIEAPLAGYPTLNEGP